MSETLLRLPQVLAMVALSRSEVYRQIKAESFPQQRRLSHKVSVWCRSEIDTWIQKQVNA